SSSRPPERSFRKTSGSPSPTTASATSTRSSRARSSRTTSRVSCASSAMPGEAEVQRRERLSRLRSLPLLRGAKLSGELERLQRQLDRIVAEPSDEQIWRAVVLARPTDPPYPLHH